MSRWLWQWKWILVAAIFAGPILSYFSYTKGNHLRSILAHGGVATAAVIRMDVQRHRSSRDYTLRIGWVDEQGQSGPHGRDVPISEQYAERISTGDGEAITINQAQIRYDLADPESDVVIVDDAAEQLRETQLNFWLGIIAAIAGVILAPLIFWLERRAEKRREAEIDEALAESRAREAAARG